MIVSRTPFRISFFGGGTDFPDWYKTNPSLVISLAIDKYCYISLRESPFASFNYSLRYRKFEQVDKIKEINHPSIKNCFEFFNFKNKKLELDHYADIPGRSGIGSSSSFTVGLLNCLYSLNNLYPSKKELSIKAIKVEQDLIKENVGSQDQVIASYGGFNSIHFYNKHFSVKKIKISNYKKKQLIDSLVLIFTGFSRDSSDISFHHKSSIKNNISMLNEINAISVEVQDRFDNGKFKINQFAQDLNHTWHIKRKLSKFVTNEHIDNIYKKGISYGALGGKLLGAGGGGFICFIVDPNYKKKFLKKFDKYLYIPVKMDTIGSKIIYKNQ